MKYSLVSLCVAAACAIFGKRESFIPKPSHTKHISIEGSGYA